MLFELIQAQEENVLIKITNWSLVFNANIGKEQFKGFSLLIDLNHNEQELLQV